MADFSHDTTDEKETAIGREQESGVATLVYISSRARELSVNAKTAVACGHDLP